MPTVQLSFNKVVFPPTSFAAVHTYTAGSFFAVVALRTDTTDNDIHLLGKELFSQLEAEFFSLEEKTLQSIKQVITTTLTQLPPGVSASLAATFIKDSVAYVFTTGGGNILIRRGEKVGHVLRSDDTATEIKAASGPIQADDLLFLQTAEFSHHITPQTVQQVSDRLSNEIADTLTTRLQTVENSAAASIILKVESVSASAPRPATVISQPSSLPAAPLPTSQTISNRPPPPSMPMTQKTYGEESSENSQKKRNLPHFSLPTLHLPVHLPTKTLIGLGIAVIVVILLVTSVMFMLSSQQAKRDETVFQTYYPQAKQEFDSGNAVSAINSNATGAKASYQKAQELLKTADTKLSATSAQKKQVDELLAQVEDKLQASANITPVDVSKASTDDSSLLATEQKQKETYVSSDDKTIYYITTTGVYTSDSSKPVLKNESDWSQIGGFAAYNNNLYILDKKESIIKFVGGSDGYGKTNYFAKDTSPTLSNAVSMAIDSSVYVLLSDGTINKYTKGEPDTFSIKGIDKPLSNPTRIFTNADSASVYVLDNGNGRIVQLGKDGTFQKQYVADQLAKAKDIDVQEGNKKIYFLTSDGIYWISL